MEKFKKGETFKLKGCRKTWTVVKPFKHKGEILCVASSYLLNNPDIERLGIFYYRGDEIYQRL